MDYREKKTNCSPRETSMDGISAHCDVSDLLDTVQDVNQTAKQLSNAGVLAGRTQAFVIRRVELLSANF